METKPTPKLVTVVNPGNPSGTYIPEPLLKVGPVYFFLFLLSLSLTSICYIFLLVFLSRGYQISAEMLGAGLL